ncbi:MAG: hypothetical protein AB8H47_04010 [Bacteroidia bacterium]
MSTTSKAYFTSLSILFYAMAAGQLIFAIVAFFVIGQGTMGPEDAELGQLFLIIAVGLVLMTQVASRFLVNKRLEDIRKLDFRSKMIQYRALFILRIALLEGPALFCLLTYLVTGYLWLLVLGMGMLLLFLTYYPSINKVVNELELSPSERSQVENPEAIIADNLSK